jgi:hypothetical protein
MKKVGILAVSAIAVVFGAVVAFTPGFAAPVSGVAEYDVPNNTLTLNINSSTTYDQFDINDSIAAALSGASKNVSDVEGVILNTDDAGLVAVGYLNMLSTYGYTNATYLDVLQTGDIDAAAAAKIAEAVIATPTSAFVILSATGTADLSGIASVSGLTDFSLMAANVIVPVGANLVDWASALGLLQGQIITQDGKTYEVQAGGAVVEIDNPTKPADTGVL